MKQRSESPIESKDLSEYLKTEDSFALELFAHHAACAAGFQTQHGGTYTDPVTKKTRQFDVRATLRRGTCAIALAIECKRLRTSYPLLVSRLPRTKDESYHEVVESLMIPMEMWLNVKGLTPGRVHPKHGRKSLYPPEEPVAKAMVQVGRDNQGKLTGDDGMTFEKWSQAVASAHDLVSDAMDAHTRHRLSDSETFVTFVAPILVVSDDTLWTVDYAQDGAVQEQPQKIEETTFFLGKKCDTFPGPPYILTHLHIYTKTGLAKFLIKLRDDERIWRSIFEEDSHPTP